MKRFFAIRPAVNFLVLLSAAMVGAGIQGTLQHAWALESTQGQLHFQRPQRSISSPNLKFRSAKASNAQARDQPVSGAPRRDSRQAPETQRTVPREVGNPLRKKPAFTQAKKSSPSRKRGTPVQSKSRMRPSAKQVELAAYRESMSVSQGDSDPFPIEHVARKLKQHRPMRHANQVATAAHGEIAYESGLTGLQPPCEYCGSEGACEPGCGIVEPGCAYVEPGCGYADPGCGIVDPGCGIGDPSCGIVDGCGECVAPPVPDYWCFPICLPRFKVLNFWAGVHSFRDARDFLTTNRGTANYGFQQGVNIGGRAPLIGRLFPQLGYQLGYQATQSRLSGVIASDDTLRTVGRDQSFVTIGLFRRVPVGLQFGVAWDFMDEHLTVGTGDNTTDLQQLRTEISLKTPAGREIGFMSATHLNERELSIGLGPIATFQTVDQYMLFYRWHFHRSGVGRVWVGGTNNSEAILGGECQVPLSDCFSLQTGFNYLSPDTQDVRQEAWNLGMNLVWHWGRAARSASNNRFSAMFPVADNGWMFLDRAP